MRFLPPFWKIMILVCLSAMYAISYAQSSNIELTLDPVLANTELNIKGAKLIEIYLQKYNTQLITFKQSHGITSDEIIDNNISIIKKMIFDLRKIQTDKLEKSVAEKVMSKTIDQIKTLNQNLKIYLKNKSAQIQEEAKLFQESLVKVIVPFQRKLENFIQGLEGNLKAVKTLSSQQKRMLEYLDDLENESIKLKTFRNLTFKNKQEIRLYIIGIIGNIQKGVAGVKSNF